MGNSQSCRGSRSIPGRGDSCTMAWPSGNEFKDRAARVRLMGLLWSMEGRQAANKLGMEGLRD